MNGYSYSEEIAVTLEQAKKYIRRVDSNAALECIDHALKLIDAEWNALMAEIRDLEAAS